LIGHDDVERQRYPKTAPPIGTVPMHELAKLLAHEEKEPRKTWENQGRPLRQHGGDLKQFRGCVVRSIGCGVEIYDAPHPSMYPGGKIAVAHR
jgi:hypothetical protein